jgi:hypothetical protein
MTQCSVGSRVARVEYLEEVAMSGWICLHILSNAMVDPCVIARPIVIHPTAWSSTSGLPANVARQKSIVTPELDFHSLKHNMYINRHSRGR